MSIIKSVTVVLVCLASFSGHAARANQYLELDMKLRIQQDKSEKSSVKESQSRVIAQLGQAAMLTEEREDGTGFHIAVLPQEIAPTTKTAAGDGPKERNLLLKFEVSDIRKGQKIFMGSPQIHVAPGRQARITQRAEDGSILDLTVTPNFTTDP